MGKRHLIQAAIQMDRDGIRTLSRKRRPLCGHIHNPDDLIKVQCHKRAGYHTPLGVRCFTHAIEQASSCPGARDVIDAAGAERELAA